MATKGAESHSDALRAILKKVGVKITPIRLELMDYLLVTARPLSHADIQSAFPMLDRVTIYRTLASFVNCGIAHQVQGLDGVWHFCAHDPDVSGCPGNHPHFLCMSCGKMICLLGQYMPRIEVSEGNVVNGKQFVAYGTCRECASRIQQDQQAQNDGGEQKVED